MSIQEGGGGEGGLIFALVARGAFVLAEHSDRGGGTFREVGGRLPSQLCRMAPNTRKTYTHQGYAYHCLVAEAPDFADRLVYVAMAAEAFSPSAAFAFLADVDRRFRAELATAQGDYSGFARVLRERMAHYSSDPAATRVREARAAIEQTRTAMAHNIDLALDRGERIEVLVDKTVRLSSGAASFRATARRQRRGMACNRCCVSFVLGLLLLLVLAVVFFLLCWFGVIPPFWQHWFHHHSHSSSF